MEKRPAEEDIKLRLANLVSDAQDALFERFDDLHTKGIHDNDVIGYLRAEGLRDVAAAYIVWAEAIDPEDQEGDDPAVPDPGGSLSYTGPGATVGIYDYPSLPGFPRAVHRDGLLHQIEQLQKDYIGRYHTDPVFHTKARYAGNFLEHLDFVNQLGDTQRAGFLLMALLTRLEPQTAPDAPKDNR